MDIYDAEFGWISMWLLSVISGWLTYTCARTAAKVHIQVRIIHVPDKASITIFYVVFKISDIQTRDSLQLKNYMKVGRASEHADSSLFVL